MFLSYSSICPDLTEEGLRCALGREPDALSHTRSPTDAWFEPPTDGGEVKHGLPKDLRVVSIVGDGQLPTGRRKRYAQITFTLRAFSRRFYLKRHANKKTQVQMFEKFDISNL